MPSSFFRFLVSAGERTWSWSSRRLRVDDLCSNLCWLLACSRMSLPVPVTRTRLAVPLWVFCFGMSLGPVRRSVSCGSTGLPHDTASVVRSCGARPEPGRSGAGRLLVGRGLLGRGLLGRRPVGLRLPAFGLRGVLGLLGLQLRVPVRG